MSDSTIQERVLAARAKGEVHEFDVDWKRWRGDEPIGRFAHWCNDWDGLPVDENCVEAECCHDCDYDDEAKKCIAQAVEAFEAVAPCSR